MELQYIKYYLLIFWFDSTASIPTASYGGATETVEVKPAVAAIPLGLSEV